ncbi:MAG: TrmH family RNA methyltransferase [Anaerolineaceae bacterium]
MKNTSLIVYLIRECTNRECEFRFPAPEDSGIGINCPKCKSITNIIREIVLNPDLKETINQVFPINNLEVVLDNVRSSFNVGAIFRSSDGAGISKIHLCGICPSPLNIKVHKTALGSELSVPYEIHNNALKLIRDQKKLGKRIWALEKTNTSISIEQYKLCKTDPSTVLVVGNEISGIDPDILAICDAQIHIPMSGIKGSLNVAIAFGIAIYNLLDFSSY